VKEMKKGRVEIPTIISLLIDIIPVFPDVKLIFFI
jgi:hypothetical protein